MSRLDALTRDDLAAILEHPEQATLRISPQVLAEFMDGHWVRPDGRVVRMTEVYQWDDGALLPVFTVSDE